MVNKLLVESGDYNTFAQNDLGVSVAMNSHLALKAGLQARRNSDVDADTQEDRHPDHDERGLPLQVSARLAAQATESRPRPAPAARAATRCPSASGSPAGAGQSSARSPAPSPAEPPARPDDSASSMRCANAATGTWQLPCRARFIARSASTQMRVAHGPAPRTARAWRDRPPGIRPRWRPARVPATSPARPAARGCALETQPLQPGAGQHDGVVVARIQLGQARVDVAAQVQQLQVGAAARATAPAGAARKCPRARPAASASMRCVLVGDEGVGRVGALQDRRAARTARPAPSARPSANAPRSRLRRAAWPAPVPSGTGPCRRSPPASDPAPRRRACSSAPGSTVEAGMRGAQRARPRVRSARGRAGSCGWRCAAWSCGHYEAGAPWLRYGETRPRYRALDRSRRPATQRRLTSSGSLPWRSRPARGRRRCA